VRNGVDCLGWVLVVLIILSGIIWSAVVVNN
jgi:hypothetical protein